MRYKFLDNFTSGNSSKIEIKNILGNELVDIPECMIHKIFNIILLLKKMLSLIIILLREVPSKLSLENNKLRK